MGLAGVPPLQLSSTIPPMYFKYGILSENNYSINQHTHKLIGWGALIAANEGLCLWEKSREEFPSMGFNDIGRAHGVIE